MTLLRPKMPKIEKPCLLISLPKIYDTFLVNRSMTEVIERAKNAQSGPIYQKLMNSGFLEATNFPPAITCPKLVIECTNHYDPNTRCVKKILGELIVKINRTSVYSALGSLTESPMKHGHLRKPNAYMLRGKIVMTTK